MKQQIHEHTTSKGGLEVGCSKSLIHKALHHHTTYTTTWRHYAGGSPTPQSLESFEKGWFGGVVVYS